MPRSLKDIAKEISGLESLYATRHGQSQGQLDIEQYRLLGDDNIPLTELGHRQSHHTGELINQFQIKVASLEHSTSLRATQTGLDILNALKTTPENGIVAEPRIDKQKFGLFDGYFSDTERSQVCPAAYEQYQKDLKQFGPLATRPPGGESILDVAERVGRFLREAGQSGKPHIVVSHGLVILTIEALLLKRSEDWLLEHQDTTVNAELTHFAKHKSGIYLKETIEDSHLVNSMG